MWLWRKSFRNSYESERQLMQPFTLLIKPSGSDCNIDCQYCFYKCRAPEIGQGRQRMSDAVLEKLVTDYMKLRRRTA